jgi:hypothetical protein
MNVYTLAEVAELERDLNETDGAFTRDGALEALEQMLPNEFRRYGFGSYAWGDSGTLCWVEVAVHDEGIVVTETEGARADDGGDIVAETAFGGDYRRTVPRVLRYLVQELATAEVRAAAGVQL